MYVAWAISGRRTTNITTVPRLTSCDTVISGEAAGPNIDGYKKSRPDHVIVRNVN